MKICMHIGKAMSETWKREFLICVLTIILKTVLNVIESELFHVSKYSANGEINCFLKRQCG